MNIAKPPDENLSSDQFDFIESLGNGEKIKCDIETVQGRLTATNVFKADGNFILMPHNHAYNYKSPMMSHGNRQGQKTFLSYSIDHISSLGISSLLPLKPVHHFLLTSGPLPKMLTKKMLTKNDALVS